MLEILTGYLKEQYPLLLLGLFGMRLMKLLDKPFDMLFNAMCRRELAKRAAADAAAGESR